MSISEVERFAADLKANDSLRAEAAKAQAIPADGAADRVVAFAASRGYAFSAADIEQHVTKRKLTEAELAGVVAGQANPTIPAVEQASQSFRIDMGKLDVGKAGAKTYGDLSSKD